MKKSGFTLIELLAVIVILAIIALIATPIVLNIIDDAKKESSVRSVENYIKAVELALANEILNDQSFNPSLCIIQKDNEISCDGITNGKTLKLGVKGEQISGGYITIKNGVPSEYSVVVGGEEITTEAKKEETPLECFTYEETEEGTITITGYTCGGESGTHKDVVIPKEIARKKVTVIDSNAFSNNQLTSVVIPNSVITIGLYAFSDNQLTSVVIPNSVITIGNSAFNNNQLTSVVIPNSVITMGVNAFANNQLTSILIPNSVTTISNGVFMNNQLTSVVIPNSVTAIPTRTFYNNQLTSVVIPNSVTTIGSNAFNKNQLTSVVIKGKSSTSDFDSYGAAVFGWSQDYSDENIIWES